MSRLRSSVIGLVEIIPADLSAPAAPSRADWQADLLRLFREELLTGELATAEPWLDEFQTADLEHLATELEREYLLVAGR